MQKVIVLPAIVALMALGTGCAGRRHAPRDTAPAVSGWRAVATPADRHRLSRWREAWVAGMAGARRTAPSAIAGQSALFAFDSALPDPLPPPGRYRCRVFKLGAKSGSMLDYVAYSWFDCSVTADARGLAFAKLTGSQRPAGLLYPDGTTRGVFLGTLGLGDETRTINYGRDATRDMAGWVERIGARRWRLALPYPAFESLVDVMELVPAE